MFVQYAGSMDVVQDVLGIISDAEHIASCELLPPEHFWTDDTLLTLCGELWHSESWTEDGLCRMPCQEPGQDARMEDITADDLDYLMPQSCSFWRWEEYGLPELVSTELEHFLRTHNENAARRHRPASTDIEHLLMMIPYARECETRRRLAGPRCLAS